jgi:hydrogenase maturation protease
MTKKIRILGVGTVLMQDDGFGPYTVSILQSQYRLPDHVEVQDVGTPGLDFAPYLDQASAVIVVDTVVADGPPGSIHRYDKDQMLAKPLPDRTNPHQPGLRETLMACELTDSTPDEVIVIGVVPERTDNTSRLGDTVRAAVPEAIAAVIRELERLGAPATRRDEPLEPDIWWE